MNKIQPHNSKANKKVERLKKEQIKITPSSNKN